KSHSLNHWQPLHLDTHDDLAHLQHHKIRRSLLSGNIRHIPNIAVRCSGAGLSPVLLHTGLPGWRLGPWHEGCFRTADMAYLHSRRFWDKKMRIAILALATFLALC